MVSTLLFFTRLGDFETRENKNSETEVLMRHATTPQRPMPGHADGKMGATAPLSCPANLL
jgi:hypothetical protein